MAERSGAFNFSFVVGILFVIGVVIFAWVTRSDEGAAQRAVAHTVAPREVRDAGR